MSIPEPGKFTTLWAITGIKNSIPPSADPATGRAGFDQGFPPVTMTPKVAGGIPPWGGDFNGILFSITEALRYIQSGGAPTFSATLSTAIGGYNKGAMLISNDGSKIYFNTVDGNTADPNSGGAGWSSASFSFGANGYISLPSFLGGFIIQWVVRTTGNMSAGAQEVASGAWPIPFPNNIFGVVASARRTVTSGAAFSNPDTYTGTQKTNFSVVTTCTLAGKFDITAISIGN